MDQLLVSRGHAQSTKVAQSWILQRRIVVDGIVRDKAGWLVLENCAVHVRGEQKKFASRGGQKLEAALDRFAIDVTGLSVLDAGASTGGFTDCLLERGAGVVHAVDVGFGQLLGRLAADPRVVNLERTNVGDLDARSFRAPIELATMDLSYLSITKAIPLVHALFERPPELVCLLKPLFEGVEQDAMQDPRAFRVAMLRVFDAALRDGLHVHGAIPSPIPGNRSSIEFLIWLREPKAARTAAEACDAALTELAAMDLSTHSRTSS